MDRTKEELNAQLATVGMCLAAQDEPGQAVDLDGGERVWAKDLPALYTFPDGSPAVLGDVR